MKCTIYNTAVDSSTHWHIKLSTKNRLQQKFQWLFAKYYQFPASSTTPFIDVPAVSELDDNRTTIIPHEDLHLTDEEKSLLALGPKFAIAPAKKDNIKHCFNIDIAHTALNQLDQSDDNQSANVNNYQSDNVINQSDNVNIQPDNVNNVNGSQSDVITEEATEKSCYKQIKEMGCNFQTPFFNVPQTQDILIEEKLGRLQHNVSKIIDESVLPKSLNLQQSRGLKSLKERDDISISISDKGGEFVVSKTSVHRSLTINHLKSTSVYKWVPPTRQYNGEAQLVKKPTSTTYNNQIISKKSELEGLFNNMWYNICDRENRDYKTCHLLAAHYTSLPTMYTLVKTHKIPIDQNIADLELENIKVRPIVSCSGSPEEKLAWLVAQILKPLLKHVPPHLGNTHDHIVSLSSLPPDELKSLQFYSADISALYTNINVNLCIDNVMDMAAEY